MKPNAAHQVRREADARHERTLEAVTCMRLFGAGCVEEYRSVSPRRYAIFLI
jgi:hypothetical protein